MRKWAQTSAMKLQQESSRLEGLVPQIGMIANGPLDVELSAAVASEPSVATLNQQIAALQAYIASTAGLFGFLAFGKKKAAATVLASFGLPLSSETAKRARDFLNAIKARVVANQTLDQLTGSPMPHRADEELVASANAYRELLKYLVAVQTDPHLHLIAGMMHQSTLASRESTGRLISGLNASVLRANEIVGFESEMSEVGMFSDFKQQWMQARSFASGGEGRRDR